MLQITTEELGRVGGREGGGKGVGAEREGEKGCECYSFIPVAKSLPAGLYLTH